jgi:amino acid adenylation domain-containing protein
VEAINVSHGIGKLTICSCIEERTNKVPDQIAVIFKNTEITYAELNEKVSRMASSLRHKGVARGDIVCIMAKRSVEMLVGILAVLQAGGAYVPIDPDFPADRIQYMLEDSKSIYLLVSRDLKSKARSENTLILEDLDSIKTIDQSEKVSISGNDLAYIIYTSGSSGRPKGVMVEHHSVINFFNGIADRIDFSERKRIVALTTISFDIFVLETLLSLSFGLTVILADESEQNNPKLLAELIRSQADMIQMTPSRLQLLLNYDQELQCLERVQEVMVGGERLPPHLLDKLRAATKAKIYNMYGPTETTVWSTVSHIKTNDSINIGMPILNTQIYILDANNNLVPEGEEGELCIAGDGVARGYLNMPSLTAEKFVSSPYKPGERMYRTGDLARWLPDGKIEYIGRIDDQVKIRGHRIELGEIEVVLVKYNPIRQAVLTEVTSPNSNPHLCAYYVADEEIDIDNLRGYLQSKLPESMIPTLFYRLNNLPLTPNGKVDKKALPQPELRIANDNESEPSGSNQLESEIMKIVQDCLDIPILVNSLELELEKLGVDSMIFIKIVTTLEAKFDFDFRDDDLDMKKFPTVQSLVLYVAESSRMEQ